MIALSIVVPTFNEADTIIKTLGPLQAGRREGRYEIIACDGGSRDNTVELMDDLVDRIVTGAKGRAQQMNCGAQQACAPWLLFLHADTHLPENFDALLEDARSQQRRWGFFTVRLSGSLLCFRVIERAMNLRSRLTSVATGDQAIFIERSLWRELGGYADITLMEDIELSKRARVHGKPHVITCPLTTSSRRWEQRGVVQTVLLMWWLRGLYFLGVSPHRLATLYR